MDRQTGEKAPLKLEDVLVVAPYNAQVSALAQSLPAGARVGTVAGILIAVGVVVALSFSGTFSLGAWVAGVVLFVFAWIGRSIATGEAPAPSAH